MPQPWHDAAAFNRWMRKTARPVVWEGAGTQFPAPDPIAAAVALKVGVDFEREIIKGGGADGVAVEGER